MTLYRKIKNRINAFFTKLSDDNVSTLSAEVAYFLFLSLFPLIMFSLSVIQYTPLANEDVISKLQGIFPTTVYNVISSILADISFSKNNILLATTLFATLWSMSKGTDAIVRGVNASHGIKEHRNFFVRKILSAFYTFIFIIILVLSMTLLVFGNRLLLLLAHKLDLSTDFVLLVSATRFLITIIMLFGFFVLLYKFLPSMPMKLKQIVPGSIFAAVAWLLTSFVFSIYVDNFSNFSYMYGSLASVVITMIWFYILANIIILGAELNAFFMRRTGLLPALDFKTEEEITTEAIKAIITED